MLAKNPEIRDETAALMSSIVTNMNDMNANEGTDAGPRCTSGEPSTNQHPKSRWFFAAKDERRES